MKNKWMNFLSGSVKVKVQGKGIERFVNKCLRNGIHIWNVKKQDEHTATFFIFLKDVPAMRVMVRKSGCKLFFIGKSGLPFLGKKMLRNTGFLIGIFLFFALVFLLSNMVWNVRIEGAKPETEYRILKELKHMGVEKGAFQFLLDPPEVIQQKLTDRIETITWVGVELKGTTFYFQVVEKKKPKEPEAVGVRHLVAKKKAVITHMFVEEGQPLVAVHDYVNKGQVLVSGIIGKEGKTKLVPARGKIFGETWYKSTVVLPFDSVFQVYTGKYMEKHYIAIGSFSLPVWGFKKPPFSHYKTENQKRALQFWRWKLPIYYERVIYRENEEVKRSYTWNEALQKAKEMARNELEGKLEADASIVGEKILHATKENGKVKVEIHYQVVENIAIPQPIVQGD
ncbi:sporulation protein YqfD [Anoxybacillus sp. PDR2]|uniref:Sporulation protein YqfD n=1 Tax=Anoxybacteroides rupiense TaxID=311460 RepID=A0ABD5IRH1_9BACL|nr:MULTISPECIES: sporulation protein YqfD [Anoxybacillus]MED5050885.1 sporulation protein YqfD [Anoxybacillus rupiensis]QHC04814.1 sporulation protein YqfD [Anoxybacillus sp. PDR2]